MIHMLLSLYYTHLSSLPHKQLGTKFTKIVSTTQFQISVLKHLKLYMLIFARSQEMLYSHAVQMCYIAD